MTPARRFGLVHLTLPIFAALPCVHVRVGDTAIVFSLYALFLDAPIHLSARQSAPWMIFALMIGIGASFAFRSAPRQPARHLAIAVTAFALVVFLDQTLAMLPGYTQPTLPCMPPIELHAGAGLWCMLIALSLALGLASRLPRKSEPSAR